MRWPSSASLESLLRERPSDLSEESLQNACAGQPAIYTFAGDTAGTQPNRVLSSKSRFQWTGVAKVLLSTDSFGLSPSNAHFHFRKRYWKGWAQRARARVDSRAPRQTQLNKPCCTQLHYLVPQKSIISIPTEICALFPSLTEDINILVSLNQLSGGRDSGAAVTSPGAAATNRPANESEWTKTKTMLTIHGSISPNIFFPRKWFLGKKSIWLIMPTKKANNFIILIFIFKYQWNCLTEFIDNWFWIKFKNAISSK